GQGIPELMADIQDTCNATARALINNLAIASGPQTEVNFDRLAPGENATAMYPWKIWQTKSSMASGNDPAVRFFQPDSNAAELMGVYEKFETKADEVTNIPRYMYGSQNVGGAGDTASGLSMLMESANKGIKAAIGHIDKGVIRRSIEGFWLHNMLYNPDRSIKGDCKAVARGSSAMLMRERTQMLRQQFLAQTANPTDMQIIGIENRAKLLSTIAQQLDIPSLLDDPKAIAEQIQQSEAQNTQLQQTLAQLEQALAQLEQAEKQARVQELQAKAQKTSAEAAGEPVTTQKTKAEIAQILANIRQALGGDIAQQPERQAALEYPGQARSATGQSIVW
ncbi:MAG: hypothetical protein OIF57_10565, partial [Marinobacterium sp.]|nr:hypothetical protein [Marinobacterium sp.]